VFGLDFGEMILILVVGIVVVGPRNLPTLMRTAGRWVSKLRRMSSDLRSQSGIDDLIRQEGLEKELSELRALSRVNVIDTFMTPALTGAAASAAKPKPAVPSPAPAPKAAPPAPDEPSREREYPVIGCDAYDVLPDDALPYPEPTPPPAKPELAKVADSVATPPGPVGTSHTPGPVGTPPTPGPVGTPHTPAPAPAAKIDPEPVASAPTNGTRT
jgi:sec-independent protein translocase protein TatB